MFGKEHAGEDGEIARSGQLDRQSADAASHWWRAPVEASASTTTASARAHAAMAVGNVIRLLVLFHLPLVAFATYQLSLSRSVTSSASVGLAALSLAVLGVLVPAALIWHVRRLPVELREGDRHTLLAFGPLYNTFADGSQTFFALHFTVSLIRGVIIGSLQGAGSAQAIVLLALEIVETLVATLWLPWGE